MPELSFESIGYPEQPLHVRFFTFESLSKLPRQSGFQINMEAGMGLLSPIVDPFLCKVFKN